MIVGSSNVFQTIEEVFSKLPYPKSSLICDMSYSDGENDELLEVFAQKRQGELLFEDIRYRENLISYLPAEFFEYYFPDLIRFSLYDKDGAELLADAVIQRLTPPLTGGEPRPFWLEGTFLVFSQEEKQAIKLFLEFMVGKCHIHCAEEALNRIWSKV